MRRLCPPFLGSGAVSTVAERELSWQPRQARALRLALRGPAGRSQGPWGKALPQPGLSQGQDEEAA